MAGEEMLGRAQKSAYPAEATDLAACDPERGLAVGYVSDDRYTEKRSMNAMLILQHGYPRGEKQPGKGM